MAIYTLQTRFFNLTAGLNEGLGKLNYITLYYPSVYGEISTTRYLSELIHERIKDTTTVTNVQQEGAEHSSIHQNDPHFSFSNAVTGCQKPHVHFKCENSELEFLFNQFAEVIAIAGTDFEIDANFQKQFSAGNRDTIKDKWQTWASDIKPVFSTWFKDQQSESSVYTLSN